jgi:hypothetical protein
VPITVLSNPQLKLHFGVDGSTNSISSPDVLNFKYAEAKKEMQDQWKGEEEMIRAKLHVMGMADAHVIRIFVWFCVLSFVFISCFFLDVS